MKRFAAFLVVLVSLVLAGCDVQSLDLFSITPTPTSSGTLLTPTSSGTLLTPTIPPTEESPSSNNCTYTQGYWKNHPLAWPVAELTLGGVTYSQAEAADILHTVPQGDATYILAHQLIAAKLNVSQGADDTAIAAIIVAADDWLAAHPLASNPSDAEREAGIALAEMLDDYNNGLVGPGHCDDVTPAPTAILSPTLAIPTATPSSTVVLPTPPVEPTPATADCTGADPQPKGTTLAERYGVPYEVIMEHFCSGFGFGEIERAYDLSLETGTPVDDIFALRESGLGWGAIRDQLGSSPGNSDKDKKAPSAQLKTTERVAKVMQE